MYWNSRCGPGPCIVPLPLPVPAVSPLPIVPLLLAGAALGRCSRCR